MCPPVRPFDCIRHLIANGNPDHLLIGAQDEPIRKLVRHCAGVPLLFIHGSTCIMEAPTVTTKEAHADDVAKQIAVIQKEEKRLVHEAKKGVKTEAGGAGAAAGGAAAASSSSSSSSAAIASKKKKKPKGPKVRAVTSARIHFCIRTLSAGACSRTGRLEAGVPDARWGLARPLSPIASLSFLFSFISLQQPNPLSVKKKKAPTGPASASDKKIKTESGAASAGAGASEKKVKTEGGASSSGGADATDGADARPTKKIKTESGAASASASASSVAASPSPAASSAAAPAPAPPADGAASSSAAGGSKGRKRARSYKKKADAGAGSSESASATAPAASMDDAP